MPKQKKKYLSENFAKKIFEASAGYFPKEKFDSLLFLIEQEAAKYIFTREAESNLLRIILNSFDKISFLNDLIKYPHHIEILTAVSVNSNYLSDIFIRNPEYFYWISNPSNLNQKLELENFKEEIRKSLANFKTLEAKINLLKRVKRKEILKIGIRDILEKEKLENIIQQLSVLALAIIENLFEVCYNEILLKHNLNLKKEYSFIALGKLGGMELNYSSDVDLIIFFDKDEEVKKNKYYSEILSEAIFLFVESATKITGAGYIYRVDLRLRPDGRTSLLTRSINEYLNYYEMRGEVWEKQMLIKAGFAGGSRELYDKFINYLQPFIYPASFSVSPTEQIRIIKSNIERSLSGEENIKLIPGGIRDIEFSVQALQLLNGGRIKEIRTPNTLRAIELLMKHNLLTSDEGETFRKAYILYRKIEHFLQLMNDKQTHDIPQSGEHLEKLSSFLGFKNVNDFKSNISLNRKAVSKIYNSIVGDDNSASANKHKLKISFENKKKAEQNLDYLKEGKGILGEKQFDAKTISLFNSLSESLFNYLNSSKQPDTILQNFARIVRSSSFPSLWYNEFKDENFFHSFLRICEFSQKGVDTFAEDRQLHDIYLSRKIFTDFNPQNIKQLTFFLAVNFTLGLISYKEFSDRLSSFFQNKINDIASKVIPKKLNESGYFIASMGSFGSNEMTFNSDIDLIFCVEDILTKDVHKYFQKVLQKIKEDAKPFEADCRLRPEGKSSDIVWDIKGYKNYINNRMRVWEFQSITRINFISGSKHLFDSFNKIIENKISSLPKIQIEKEIYEMRKKLYPQTISNQIFNLKRSPGGIIDIEFLAQYLILCNNNLFETCRGKGTEESLITLSSQFKDLKKAADNFSFLKKLDITNQNLFNATSSIISLDSRKIKLLSEAMGFENEEEFRKRFLEITLSNQKIFKDFLT